MEVILINLTKKFHDILEGLWKTNYSKMAIVYLFDYLKYIWIHDFFKGHLNLGVDLLMALELLCELILDFFETVLLILGDGS
jgi:hypothetical protein